MPADNYNDIILRTIPEFLEQMDEYNIIIPIFINKAVDLSNSAKHKEALAIFDQALELTLKAGEKRRQKSV